MHKYKSFVLYLPATIGLSPVKLKYFLIHIYRHIVLHLIESIKFNSQPNLDFFKIYCLLISHSTVSVYISLENALHIFKKNHSNLLM